MAGRIFAVVGEICEMRKIYKYSAAITSQLAFCATPLRLDSYNHCQFSCGYCFARTREGYGRDEKLQIANPESLKKRLKRVADGVIRSALDEFIQMRIPFQMGGMSDPFSPVEIKERRTLQYIRILNEYDYPFIISTKSSLPGTIEYTDALGDSNGYVRFSTTVVSEKDRASIDKGCPPIREVADAAERLSALNIPVSFRMQPIIPGHEDNFDRLLALARNVGVKHISAEYLKVPLEANVNFSRPLLGLLGGEPIATYMKLGSRKQGSEYALPLSYRAAHLIYMRGETKAAGITFGFADNELLLHSDGGSCCSASDLYLRNASFFSANIVALAKKKMIGELITFDDFIGEWMPQSSIATYLNSKSRLEKTDVESAKWITYLRAIWGGNYGLYSPSYFDGVIDTGTKDLAGLPVYMRVLSEFEMSMGFALPVKCLEYVSI